MLLTSSLIPLPAKVRDLLFVKKEERSGRKVDIVEVLKIY